jgi:hypothetical protein
MQEECLRISISELQDGLLSDGDVELLALYKRTIHAIQPSHFWMLFRIVAQHSRYIHGRLIGPNPGIPFYT